MDKKKRKGRFGDFDWNYWNKIDYSWNDDWLALKIISIVIVSI